MKYKKDYSRLLYFILSDHHLLNLSSFNNPSDFFVNTVLACLQVLFIHHFLFFSNFVPPHSPLLSYFIHPLPLSSILHSSTLPFFHPSFIHSPFLPSFIHPRSLPSFLHSSALPFSHPSFIYLTLRKRTCPCRD